MDQTVTDVIWRPQGHRHTKKLGMFIHMYFSSALRFFHINKKLTEKLA